MLKKIAITGNLATGKSTFLKILKKLGFLTLSCDDIVKELYQDPQVREEIEKLLVKKGILSANQALDKEILLKLVVENVEIKKGIEEILHPKVLKRVLEFFKESQEKVRSLCFVEVPLFFEAGWEKYFDEVWVISCSLETQRKRLLEKETSAEYYLKLAELQMPLSEKERRANLVFSSEENVEILEKKLRELLKEYLKD